MIFHFTFYIDSPEQHRWYVTLILVLEITYIATGCRYTCASMTAVGTVGTWIKSDCCLLRSYQHAAMSGSVAALENELTSR